MKLQQFGRITAMLFVAGACLYTGCASMETGRLTSFTIKVVDERNNQPVPGVSAVWREDLNDVIFGPFQIGPTNLQPSDDAGIIKIFPVRERMIGSLILSRPGGFTLYCKYSESTLEYSKVIIGRPQDYFVLAEPRTWAVWTNGYFVVSMPRDVR